MVTRDYETQCPLLAHTTLERLRECGTRRLSRLRQQIEIAEACLRTLPPEMAEGGDDCQRPAAEIDLRCQAIAVSKEIIALAVTLAEVGVRQFAEAFVASQGRLGVHADYLREYTALLVNEIRGVLSTTPVFQLNPLLRWAEDPIVQKAIQACEEAIAERRKVGDHWPYRGTESSAGNPSWSPIVQEWEAFKAENKIDSSQGECIPESILRTLLAGFLRVNPQDVDWEQIREAGGELCRHYGRILVVPLQLETNRSTKAAADSKGTASFWKEREDEFRQHDTPGNSALSADWSSMGDHWVFHSFPGVTARGAEPIFKSLAREASKGFDGRRSGEPSLDWLEALRCATDDSTGKRLYSKVSTTGSLLRGEGELERMAKSGEPLAPGGLIEFMVPPECGSDADPSKQPEIAAVARAEKRMVWDTTTETVEYLFTSSANFCLELRSRIPEAGEVPARKKIEIPLEGSTSAAATGSSEMPSMRKRGPKPDYETASRVAEIVARVAPNGDWLSNLDDVCMELDDKQIPRPKTWKARHGFGNWYAAVAAGRADRGRHIAIEAIKQRLSLAKKKFSKINP